MIEYIRTSKVEAKDRRMRYITTVVCFYSDHYAARNPSITYGHSVSTHEFYNPEQGVEIARERGWLQRLSGKKRGLCGEIGSRVYHMEWLEKNRKIRKAYVDRIHESFCKNINNFIWQTK